MDGLTGGCTDEERASLTKWADKGTCRRFLTGQKWDAEAAMNKVKATLQWRKDFRPDLISADEVEPEGVTGKSFISGFDRRGQPLLYSIHRLDKTKTFDRYLRYCLFLLEKCLVVMPAGVERMTFLIDNGGLGVFNAPPVSFVTKFIGIAEAHYPQRLDTAIMLNPSWFVFGLFKVVSPYMDPVVRAKIHFSTVSPRGTSSANTNTSAGEPEKGTGGWTNIFQYIDESQLPLQFGGTSTFVYDHAVFWNAITKVQ
ncbi:CRAL-TRIO domain-containing protein [Chytriomyces sp. MP71]|nr:CRAL-TRIO domain-containing protein [Chytriomyces sp. MP71]